MFIFKNYSIYFCLFKKRGLTCLMIFNYLQSLSQFKKIVLFFVSLKELFLTALHIIIIIDIIGQLCVTIIVIKNNLFVNMREDVCNAISSSIHSARLISISLSPSTMKC